MDKHIATLEEMLKDFDGALAHDEIDAVNAAIALMRDDCARRAAMDKHASAQEELAIARATIESLRMRLSGCESALAERDAAIALMRGQSWKRELIDDIQRRFEVGEVPKITEARAEYWKAGARWAIGIVNVAIHELHNPPKDTADEQ